MTSRPVPRAVASGSIGTSRNAAMLQRSAERLGLSVPVVLIIRGCASRAQAQPERGVERGALAG